MSGRAGAPSRNQQAFRWLLTGDDDDKVDQPRRPPRGSNSGGGSATKAGAQRRASGGGASKGYIPGFKLRCEPANGQGGPSMGAGSSGHLSSLQQAFAGVLPPDLVADVVLSCGGDAAAAMEALLAVAGSSESGSSAAAEQSHKPTPAARTPAAAPGGPCYWDALPTECKGLVFEQLSLRELACAARACREFATYVRQQRSSLRTVVVPEGVSLTAVRGLVASFAGASTVSLSRCAGQLRFLHEFEDMFQAVKLGETDRPTAAPVSKISLARCGRANDAVVAALCDTFTHLRRLDLDRCVEVSDAALMRLAAYTRQSAATDTSGSDGEDGWEDLEEGAVGAAAAAVGDMQLSSAGVPPTTAAPPAMESPDSAVRRIAAQRHADMMARTTAAAMAQLGRPVSCGLEELCLKETSVSARGIKLLLQPGSASSKSLKVLDVSRCPNLGGDALDLHPGAVLEVLRASGCNALRSVVIQLPPEAPLLALHLDSCRQLHEVVLVAHRLEAANFSHCGQLRTISLRCRRLRELRAVNCGSLTLADSELHCPALREVNLFGCRQVDAEGLEAVATSLSKCASLDLTGCTGLSRLLLPEATFLQHVSVSGCGLLRQVLLASPALSHFKAAGCNRLMDLRLGTASLLLLDLENCCHLREVQLSKAVAPSASGSRGTPGSWQSQDAGGCARQKRSLVLKGCTSLSDDVKRCLRDAVTGP